MIVLSGLAPRLKLPVLLLQGKHDGDIDPAYAKKLSAPLPGSTIKLYPGLDHRPAKATDITQDSYSLMETAPLNGTAERHGAGDETT